MSMAKAQCELASCISLGHSNAGLGFASSDQEAVSPTATDARAPDSKWGAAGHLRLEEN